MQSPVPTGGYIYSIIQLQSNPNIIAIKSNVIQQKQRPSIIINRVLEATNRDLDDEEEEAKLIRWVYVPSNILERRDLATSIVEAIVGQRLGKRLRGKQIQIQLNSGIPIKVIGTIFDDLTERYFNFTTVKPKDDLGDSVSMEDSDVSNEDADNLDDFVVPDEQIMDLSASYDEDAEEEEDESDD